jgi:hypothetical protein
MPTTVLDERLMGVPSRDANRIDVQVGDKDVTGAEGLLWKVAGVTTSTRLCLVTAAIRQRESFMRSPPVEADSLKSAQTVTEKNARFLGIAMDVRTSAMDGLQP